MAKRDILHEMEEYLYPTLQKLTVGKILRTWRSDRSAIHGQTAKELTATFKSKFWPLEYVAVWSALVAVKPWSIQGLAVRPPWNKGWRSDRQGLFQPPESYFFGQRFSKVFNWFKFRDHSEIFTVQGEEQWCLLRILDNILIRIMNLSKWQL
jgi:hypothetical protein